ncbi:MULTISPECIES: DUF3703 domain-containing protein [Flavobacteriaceae]|jgi:hypothetical protein|uniref:DUF3703 domain-containing protein n=2 Tax=Maribacter TaxID=252356 RepID=A0A5R8M6L7_9FLAO|nr:MULTISPECIES: DUF3703 domain-containing protein [Flavobacteriaceae]MCI5055227.1 DUF3703 domain-containing protein [Flavobacteriales bacterium]KAA2218707.1 DUF3703 domain-containing protein [Maribacter flavus]MAU26843.1 hypothetical protein [Allomuricauda sp.]MBC29623.1 hypothetical protein [Allomuricauda sp.]TLF45222.1 DUF3703 domain-containing protein [Maribacter aurantiacus]|tara:strand:- start:2427 stop:2801 length:375 start_codon:yes stop_codon:yes gene_type:complete
MKFNTTIPIGLRAFYLDELNLYRSSLHSGNSSQAWHHLERSHILGQSYPLEHTYTHWSMLKFGLRQRNTKEVLGQVLRLLVGGWKSFIDHVPIGNTGGSDVPPLKRMEMPEDIAKILNKYRKTQ